MNVTNYPYRSMSPREVILFNQLFQKDPGLTFKLGPDSYTLYFEPERIETPVHAPLKALVKHMDGLIHFELCPEEKLLHMMLTDVASLEDFKTLPEELRGVTLESALERVLDHIDQLSGTRSTIERMSDNAPHKVPSLLQIHFSLIRKKDALRARGYIRTDGAGLHWIAGRMGRLTAKTHRRLNHLPVTGSIELARIGLTGAEINGLEPNDIVLAEETGAWDDRVVNIRFSHGLALGGNMVESDRILIQDIIKGNGERKRMRSKKEYSTKSADLPVEDIPVELVFELGQTDITMGELKHLQPGYTIQLDEAIDRHKPVTIKGNGVAVGRGEIVLIDDHLGIRILEFNKEMGSM